MSLRSVSVALDAGRSSPLGSPVWRSGVSAIEGEVLEIIWAMERDRDALEPVRRLGWIGPIPCRLSDADALVDEVLY